MVEGFSKKMLHIPKAPWIIKGYSFPDRCIYYNADAADNACVIIYVAPEHN